MRAAWVCALLTLLPLSAEASVKIRGSEYARKAKAKGRRFIKELSVDFQGDGRPEVAVIERYRGKLTPVVVRWEGPEDEGRFVEVLRGSPGRAKKIVRFEARRLRTQAGEDLVVVFEDPSPDDRALRVRMIGETDAGLREIFAHTFLSPSRRHKIDAESLGDAGSRVRLSDDDGDGVQELSWTKGPVVLTLKGRNGPARFVVGAEREVFAFDGKRGRYGLRPGVGVVDFLEPHKISKVEASSQVAKIWGTAQPFWGADGDLKTSWNVLRRQAKGATLSVRLARARPVRMLRVVPGCAHSADAWEEHDRVRRFTLTLSSGKRFSIDRRNLQKIPTGVQALGELPLPEGAGSQLIVVLQKAEPLVWARLEVDAVERSRRRPTKAAPAEVCVAEVSFH